MKNNVWPRSLIFDKWKEKPWSWCVYLITFDIPSKSLFSVMLREECGWCCLCVVLNFLSDRFALHKMFQSKCSLATIIQDTSFDNHLVYGHLVLMHWLHNCNIVTTAKETFYAFTTSFCVLMSRHFVRVFCMRSNPCQQMCMHLYNLSSLIDLIISEGPWITLQILDEVLELISVLQVVLKCNFLNTS